MPIRLALNVAGTWRAHMTTAAMPSPRLTRRAPIAGSFAGLRAPPPKSCDSRARTRIDNDPAAERTHPALGAALGTDSVEDGARRGSPAEVETRLCVVHGSTSCLLLPVKADRNDQRDAM